MGEINLDDGKILVEDQWLSAEDIKQQIQEKMAAGEMRFAALAQALEELNSALEGSQALEVRTVISKDQYRKLRAMVDGDDRACVKAAVAAFVGRAQGGSKKVVIRCASCKARIELPADERPSEVRCPECHAVGRLKSRSS
jgi:DNA-directed RNA polymerase subunit RPC12/RpoP